MVIISTVGELEVLLGLNKDKFTSGLNAAKGELSTFGTQAEGSFSKVGAAIGGAVVAGAKVAAVGAGVAATAVVKSAADQEQAFMRINKIMNLNEEQTKKMKDSYRSLSNEYGQSTVAIAAAGANLAATGMYKTQEELVQGTEALIKVNSAWGGQVEQTATYLSQVAQSYGLTTKEMEQFGSATAYLADASGASEDQVARGAIAMSGLRRELGLSLQQVMGFTSAFAEIGVQPEETETRLRSMYMTFTSGSKPALAAMKQLGIGEEQFNKAVREGKLPELFVEVAGKLRGVTSEMQRATMAGNLFGSYGKAMANDLPKVIDRYHELTTAGTQAWEENARATEESSKALNTFYGQLDRTKSMLTNIAADIGDGGLGPLKEGLYQINEFLDKAFIQKDFKAALQGLKDAIASFDWGGLAEGIRSAIGDIGSVLGEINFADILGKAIDPANISRIWEGIGDIGSGLIKKITDGLSSIGSLNWEGYFGGLSSGIQGAMAKVGDAIIAAPWGAWAQRAASVLSSALQTAIGAGLNLASWITSKINSIGTGGFSAAGKNIAQFIVDGMSNIGNYIQQNLGGWLSTGFALGGAVSSAITSFASGLAGVLGPAIKAKASDIWSGVLTYGGTLQADASKLGSDIVQALRSSIGAAAEGLLQPIADQFDNLSSKIKGLTGKDFGTIGKIDLGGSTAAADRQAVYDSAGRLISDALSPVTNLGKIGEMEKRAQAGTSQYYGDPRGYMAVAGATGVDFNTAYANALDLVQNNPISASQALDEYLKGSGGMTGKMAGYTGLAGMGGGTLGATSTGVGAGTATAVGSLGWTKASIFDSLGKGAGDTIIPSAATVKNANIMASAFAGGTVPVVVTNWPDGFGTGGATSATGAPGTFGGRAGAKFDVKDLEGREGPGIGMVGSTSSDTAYANRLNIDTCEIDSFGMTPGLGKELAASGAWKPNDSFTSMQLAKEIGYQGNYAGDSASSGAVLGQMSKTLNNTARNVANTQVTTGVKVNTAFVQAGKQAGDELFTASNAVNYSFQRTGAAQMETASYVAATGEQSALTVASTFINGATTSATIANQSAMNTFNTIGLGGANAKLSLEQGAGIFLSSANQYNNLVGPTNAALAANIALLGNTLNSASTSLSTATSGLNDWMGYFTGGASGGGGTAGGTTGAFGSSKAAWVGTRSTQYGWGAQASKAAQSQSTFYGGSGGSGTFAGTSFSFGFADGGIPTRPMYATVAENGPEAIIPLTELPKIIKQSFGGSGGGSGMVHTVVNIDGKKIADAVGPAIIQRTRQGAGLQVR